MNLLCFRVITGISILLFGCVSFGQIKEYLDVNLSTEKINPKGFNGQLKLSVENISNDTVYISLEPFIFEVVNKPGIFNYVNLMS
ncbi:MAG: hypothetical protein L0Y76_12660 [Ignavibacteria bacterium]|nr:hypothetical protein [Ignavibacteria bacterium]